MTQQTSSFAASSLDSQEWWDEIELIFDSDPLRILREIIPALLVEINQSKVTELEVVNAYVPVSGLDTSDATHEEWERWHKAIHKLWIQVGRP
jgi:hypothetical protein